MQANAQLLLAKTSSPLPTLEPDLVQPTSPATTLEQARASYDRHFAAEQYAEAVDVAHLALELGQQQLGPIELAPLHNQLGAALLETGEAAEALESYRQSEKLVRANRSVFHTELARPLLGQGLALQQLDRHEAAIEAFQRSQHIVHRNDGVLGLNQQEAIEAKAQSLEALGKQDEANLIRKVVYKIYQGKYGDQDPRVIPGLFALAQWHSANEHPRKALETYQQLLDLDATRGGNSTASLRALRGQVTEYTKLRRRKAVRNAIAAQHQVLDILQKTPALRVSDQIEAHLALGDLYLTNNARTPAWQHYRAALELTPDDSDKDWSYLFKRPELIDSGPPIRYLLSANGSEPYSHFRMTIDADGKPRQIGVVRTNLDRLPRAFAVQLFRHARFRPRLGDDGMPAATKNFEYRRVYKLLDGARAVLPQSRAVTH